MVGKGERPGGAALLGARADGAGMAGSEDGRHSPSLSTSRVQANGVVAEDAEEQRKKYSV